MRTGNHALCVVEYSTNVFAFNERKRAECWFFLATGLDGLESHRLVATGIAALVLTIFTNHRLGVMRVIPYPVHLAVDFMVSIVFAIASLLLDFSGLDAGYCWANSAAVLTVAGLHKPGPAPDVIQQPAVA